MTPTPEGREAAAREALGDWACPDDEGCPCDARTMQRRIAAALRSVEAAFVARALAVLTDLHLRPGEGTYFITRDAFGNEESRAVEPRHIEGVFKAFREALGGYEKLAEWRRQETAEAVRVAVEARDREWCDVHGWCEGLFGADGRPFTPERAVPLLRESLDLQESEIRAAVLVAERRCVSCGNAIRARSEAETLDLISLDEHRRASRSEAQATPAPEVCAECGDPKNLSKHSISAGAVYEHPFQGTPPETKERG